MECAALDPWSLQSQLGLPVRAEQERTWTAIERSMRLPIAFHAPLLLRVGLEGQPTLGSGPKSSLLNVRCWTFRLREM